MSLTLWYFRLTPAGTFARVSLAAHSRFYDREVSLEPTIPGVVLLCEVYLGLANRQPMKVNGARFDRFEVNSVGFATELSIELRRGWAAAAVGQALLRASPDYIPSIESRRARVRREQECLWKPNEEQAAALVQAINHRAKRFLVGSPQQTLQLIR